MVTTDTYVGPEGHARRRIDEMLTAAGWIVQDYRQINRLAGRGVAVREFELARGHGRADYLLFVDGEAVGVLEAKKVGTSLIGVETQSGKYADGVPDGIPAVGRPLPFAYESTGAETRFTNRYDPVPRSREVHWFHRPETLARWVQRFRTQPATATFRGGLRHLPPLDRVGLRPAQYDSILALEASLAADRPRALVQMATGAGKTFTAAAETYRMLKFAGAQRVVFLVDRGNLGRQTLREFQTFVTPDTGRKFTDLYTVQLLSSNKIDPAAQVVITTIQRLYSILSGEPELDPELDETSIEDLPAGDLPTVDYNPAVPVEAFDLLLVDECHRSIYGVWRQVLEYFDAHLVGLTATPSKQTLGFMDQNLVFSYTHEQAVADKVNVDFEVYRIRTRIGTSGSVVEADGETVVQFRDRLSGQTRLVALQDDYVYDAKQLDRAVVAEDQLRTVVRTFRDRLFTEIFPGRREVPKTLIFAKDDAHADRIVQMLRQEFDRPNEFAVKITYKTTGAKPEQLLSDFRNSYNPRIAVTVDMIATGTDIKPLECVMFLRSVKSRNFFEQMKGRGVRVIEPADFRSVTPDATTKTHFVLVDAVGVTETDLNDTTPLERQPRVGFDKLLHQAALGVATADLASSLGSRLIRLDKQLTDEDRTEVAEVSGGLSVAELAHDMIAAVNPDRAFDAAVAARADREEPGEPTGEEIAAAQEQLIRTALQPLSNEHLRDKLSALKKAAEQLIDEFSTDEVIEAGFSTDATARAKQTAADFRAWLDEHRDQLAALQALYGVPYKRRVTFRQVKELANAISKPPHAWTPERLWQAYEALDASKVHGGGQRIVTDLVSLVRFALEQDNELLPYTETVNQRFAGWLAQQERHGRAFTAEQLQWLERIRDVIGSSLAVTVDDLDDAPFAERGGLGGAYSVFHGQLEPLLDELNHVLAA
ncbi:DEAD/DEAH box helicase family protein [Modestobacter sp. L9-4]|uniref:type I restriction endonuclease subunit R n=1 Tax=Modestobacter sp. L9-4 TaxID=2851567 RepID=UPI001C78FBE3|nr:type I restriction-modification enzyme R subunit C-terminal domain-containing protein [Modestobacter sp. L9-4]QXG77483.1 DEAD/DEAH box helicase family protein [Modestobacter sp. L9-4]